MKSILRIGINGKRVLYIVGPESELKAIKRAMGSQVPCRYALQLSCQKLFKGDSSKLNPETPLLRIPNKRRKET